ncbi:MAG: MOSC domain-containing protein [Candidatus Eisenbacteria bacterium]
MSDGVLLSVRTGRVRKLPRPDWDRSPQRLWNTAYLKEEVDGPVRVGTLGLEGDEVFSTDVHGGPQMAVLAYSAGHYRTWQEELSLPTMGPGGFGENLTVEGQDERDVCIGDIYEVGEVQLQVSQPRGPCANISRRWGIPTLLKRVSETNRTGWYLRVLREGRLERGQTIRRVQRAHPAWPIERLLTLRLQPQLDPAGVRWLSSCEGLAPLWQEMYAEKAARLA